MKFRSNSRLWLVAILVLALAQGCATKTQVQDIVESSNAALAAAQILRETDPPHLNADGVDQAAQADTWKKRVEASRNEAISRIDAFLTEHGGNERLNKTSNALRLRKALILMTAGKPNLAKATFATFDASDAGNARDLGLYRAHEALVWWWKAAGDDQMTKSIYDADATKHTATLDTVIGKAPAGSAIRYYLAAVRSHIQYKWASYGPDPRKKLTDSLVAFAGQFDAAAQQDVAKWASGKVDEFKTMRTANLRWSDQLLRVRDAYQQSYQEFLDETWSSFNSSEERPEMNPKLRQLCKEDKLEKAPLWPDELAWLVKLESPPQ